MSALIDAAPLPRAQRARNVCPELTGDDRAMLEALADRADRANLFAEIPAINAAFSHLAGSGWQLSQASLGGMTLGAVAIDTKARRFGPLGGPVSLARHVMHMNCAPLLDGADPMRAAHLLMDAIHADTGASVLFAPFLPEDSPFLRAALERGGRITARHERAAIDSALSGDTYLKASFGKKRVRELNRLRRKLSETHLLEARVLAGPELLARELTAFFEIEARGWKGRAGTALGCQPHQRAFFEKAVIDLAERDRARIDALYADGAMIAAVVSVRDRDSWYPWKMGHDEAFNVYSPGTLVLQDLTMRLMGDGGVRVRLDSLADPGHPIADRLWSERRAFVHCVIPLRPGVRARLMTQAVSMLETLREKARSTLHRLKAR